MEKTKEALANAGFGIISEIDLKDKFRKKLNIDFREYRISGAVIQNWRIRRSDRKTRLEYCGPATYLFSSIKTVKLKLESIADEVSSKLKLAIDAF